MDSITYSYKNPFFVRVRTSLSFNKFNTAKFTKVLLLLPENSAFSVVWPEISVEILRNPSYDKSKNTNSSTSTEYKFNFVFLVITFCLQECI